MCKQRPAERRSLDVDNLRYNGVGDRRDAGGEHLHGAAGLVGARYMEEIADAGPASGVPRQDAGQLEVGVRDSGNDDGRVRRVPVVAHETGTDHGPPAADPAG